jgi:hypothetical protein
MKPLFTEKDFTDEGGYLLSPRWVVEMANEKVKPLIEALEILSFIGCYHCSDEASAALEKIKEKE